MFGKQTEPAATEDVAKERVVHESSSGEFPRRGSSGNSTVRVYSVEVRLDYPSPMHLGDFVIDREWRRLPTTLHPAGVPSRTFSAHAQDCGLYSWEAANALRWWAHAAAAAGPSGGLCLQSRIVEHKLTESFSVEVIGYHDVLGGGGRDDQTRLARGPLSKAATEAVALTRPVAN